MLTKFHLKSYVNFLLETQIYLNKIPIKQNNNSAKMNVIYNKKKCINIKNICDFYNPGSPAYGLNSYIQS